jgi:hypothetical protein
MLRALRADLTTFWCEELLMHLEASPIAMSRTLPWVNLYAMMRRGLSGEVGKDFLPNLMSVCQRPEYLEPVL